MASSDGRKVAGYNRAQVVYTESETIVQQTWFNVYCWAAWGGDFKKFDCAVMVTWGVYLVLDNFLVLKVECCKISGIVSNSVAASLGSHSPWHKTTEPLSWAPSWQHRDAPSWTQCALSKTLYARPSAQTLLLDGSTGLTDRAITRENRSSPKVKVTSIDTLASSLYVGLIIIYTTTDPCWPRWWPRAWWSCQHVSIERREETESVIKHHLWPDILINTPSLIFI